MKNTVSWVSIPASDFDRAVAFYRTVTGKEMKVMGEGDQRMAPIISEEEWEDGVVGFGISADPTITTGSSGPRVYLGADIDAFLSNVEEAGGKILVPKSSMGEQGSWALIEDTEGNQIGLHSK